MILFTLGVDQLDAMLSHVRQGRAPLAAIAAIFHGLSYGDRRLLGHEVAVWLRGRGFGVQLPIKEKIVHADGSVSRVTRFAMG